MRILKALILSIVFASVVEIGDATIGGATEGTIPDATEGNSIWARATTFVRDHKKPSIAIIATLLAAVVGSLSAVLIYNSTKSKNGPTPGPAHESRLSRSDVQSDMYRRLDEESTSPLSSQLVEDAKKLGEEVTKLTAAHTPDEAAEAENETKDILQSIADGLKEQATGESTRPTRWANSAPLSVVARLLHYITHGKDYLDRDLLQAGPKMVSEILSNKDELLEEPQVLLTLIEKADVTEPLIAEGAELQQAFETVINKDNQVSLKKLIREYETLSPKSTKMHVVVEVPVGTVTAVSLIAAATSAIDSSVAQKANESSTEDITEDITDAHETDGDQL